MLKLVLAFTDKFLFILSQIKEMPLPFTNLRAVLSEAANTSFELTITALRPCIVAVLVVPPIVTVNTSFV
ncbi:MAG: hypothetical protein [Bacteriophage sp.]|nr:MAG: hypothetical protein [Bacteriophage sp.]